MLKRMFFSLVLLSMFAQPDSTEAQDASLPEPQYSQQFNAVEGSQLIVLERQTAVTDTKTRRNFVITPNTKVFESIPNPASPVRVGPGAQFVVKMATADRDPQTLIHLKKLTAGKKDRQIPIVTYKESLVPFGGVKHDRAPDESIPVTIKKYGAGSFEIIPQQPLEAGEYAFVSGHDAQCFGVDAGLSSGPPAPVAATVAKPAPAAWHPQADTRPAERVTGSQASIPGTAEAGPLKGSARLIMRCQLTTFDTGIQPSATATIEVQPKLVDFDTDAMSAQAANDNSFGRSQFGQNPEITIDTGFFGTSQNGYPMIDLEYEWEDLKQIVDAPGTTLAASVLAPEKKGHRLDVHFTLPTDAAPLQGMMAPCFDRSQAEQRKAEAAALVACPALPGLMLTSIDVLQGQHEKKLPVDPEDETGSSYPLPKVTKTHPRQPLALSCSYATPDAAVGAAPAEVKRLPVPVAATRCSITRSSNATRTRAYCQ